MLTAFGHAVRQLRIERGLYLKNMADALHMGSAQLSGIEIGTSPLTSDVGMRVVEYFRPLVGAHHIAQLRAAIDQTLATPGPGVRVDAQASPAELVAAFAARLNS